MPLPLSPRVIDRFWKEVMSQRDNQRAFGTPNRGSAPGTAKRRAKNKAARRSRARNRAR